MDASAQSRSPDSQHTCKSLTQNIVTRKHGQKNLAAFWPRFRVTIFWVKDLQGFVMYVRGGAPAGSAFWRQLPRMFNKSSMGIFTSSFLTAVWVCTFSFSQFPTRSGMTPSLADCRPRSHTLNKSCMGSFTGSSLTTAWGSLHFLSYSSGQGFWIFLPSTTTAIFSVTATLTNLTFTPPLRRQSTTIPLPKIVNSRRRTCNRSLHSFILSPRVALP